MSKIKHTPGPWIACRGTVSTEDGSVFGVADCYTPSVGPSWSGTDYTGEGYQLANARLIAAAPELLDLLIKARRYVGMVTEIPGDDPIFAVMDEIDIAIAKARGQS